MKNTIASLNWRAALEKTEVESIGYDFVLFDNIKLLPVFDYPFKLDISVAIICVEGTMEGTINLKKYRAKAPGLFIFLPDQILQYEYLSEDFSGYFMIMSKQFSDNLLIDIHERFPLTRSIQDNPWIPITEEELKSMIEYYTLLKKTVEMKNNPHRVEIIKHLMQAFFYSSNYIFNKNIAEGTKSKQKILVEDFLTLVKSKFKEQRGIEYYADKLFLTPKYLSTAIKQSSGKSASEWINDFVILEAKALLRSTNMTIQQVSDELNFPSQSFFGKYFKRNVGVSPKEYRKN